MNKAYYDGSVPGPEQTFNQSTNQPINCSVQPATALILTTDADLMKSYAFFRGLRAA